MVFKIALQSLQQYPLYGKTAAASFFICKPTNLYHLCHYLSLALGRWYNNAACKNQKSILIEMNEQPIYYNIHTIKQTHVLPFHPPLLSHPLSALASVSHHGTCTVSHVCQQLAFWGLQCVPGSFYPTMYSQVEF